MPSTYPDTKVTIGMCTHEVDGLQEMTGIFRMSVVCLWLEFLQWWLESPAVLHYSIFKILPKTEFYFFSFLLNLLDFYVVRILFCCLKNSSLSFSSILLSSFSLTHFPWCPPNTYIFPSHYIHGYPVYVISHLCHL